MFIKVGKAIEAVALENGYSYSINPQIIGSCDVLLFTDERYNILDLVLKKLGITTIAQTITTMYVIAHCTQCFAKQYKHNTKNAGIRSV